MQPTKRQGKEKAEGTHVVLLLEKDSSAKETDEFAASAFQYSFGLPAERFGRPPAAGSAAAFVARGLRPLTLPRRFAGFSASKLDGGRSVQGPHH